MKPLTLLVRNQRVERIVKGFFVICGTIIFGISHGTQSPDTIGIFDLKAIRAVPIDPEILSKTKEGDINIEQIRFTAVPGVRMVATITYKDGAKGAPGYAFVELFKVKPLIAEAKSGFVGIVVEPPTGNTDPKKLESVGGPVYPQPFDFNSQFIEDKNKSYIYQYTVAMVRFFDYLATRPEVNLSTSIVTSYSWASTMVGLMRALDDRPAGYILFHGCGYFVDENGLSAGDPIVLSHANGPPTRLTRKLYEMYCPAAYAGYGTKPIYMGTALDDSYTRLDAIIEMYSHLKAPKAFAFSPNRQHMPTARNEFNGYASWVSSWLFGGDNPAKVGEGVVKVENGKLFYRCSVDSKVPLTHAEILISYGKAGNWLGRTWHRQTLNPNADQYVGEIPIYDPHVPFYVTAQIETAKFGSIANGPQFVDPQALGITLSNADYPSVLFDPSQKDDLYLRNGTAEWSADGPDGKGSAIVSPGMEGTINFQNIDGDLWTGKKSLHIWLKGDGKPGPIRAYLVFSPNYYLEVERKNFTTVDLIPSGATFTTGWNEYSIPLSKVQHLDQVSTLFFDSQKRKLQIGPIILK
jgi:hypothetical protein